MDIMSFKMVEKHCPNEAMNKPLCPCPVKLKAFALVSQVSVSLKSLAQGLLIRTCEDIEAKNGS